MQKISLPFQGGCIRSQMRSRLPDGGRMSSGSVAYQPLASGTVSTLPEFAEGPACRCWARDLAPGPRRGTARLCWLGPGPNDPLRCGLNSAHPTFAMRSLLQFAKSLRGCTMLPCFCIARLTHVLPCRFRAASFLVAWCHGWVGWGTKIFCRSSLPFQGGCIRSQMHSRLPDGGRMSSGSVAYSRWVQAQCRHSLNLQRGQHAGAGLGTWPHDPAVGQHACAG